MKKLCFRVIASALFVVTAFSVCAAFAADDKYPEKPITLIVPLPPGGANDALVRMLAPHLGREMGGATFVFEYIEGAGSQMGLTALLNAPADGYTIATANQPPLSFTIAVQGAGYKESDFAWINMHQIDPLSICVMPDKPWQNLQDLIDHIKANPGEVAIAVTQVSSTHIFALYLQEKYNLDFTIVPYSGASEKHVALMGGHVDVFLSAAFSDFPLRDKIRCIGIGADERSVLWPDTPTILEGTGDVKLAEVAKTVANTRGILASRKFKDEHPERFEKFVEAYKKAFHSKEYMADAERTGQSAIIHWFGPEESQKLSVGMNQIVADFAHYFKK